MADREILAFNLRTMAAWCKSGEDDDGSGTFIPAYPSGDVYDILMQAARELAATHPQPVTPAGGEAEPFGYFDSQGLSHAGNSTNFRWLLEQHREGKPNWGDLKLLYTHPPVADAALHDAVMSAVVKLNSVGEAAPAECYAAHDILRQALIDYADRGAK